MAKSIRGTWFVHCNGSSPESGMGGSTVTLRQSLTNNFIALQEVKYDPNFAYLWGDEYHTLRHIKAFLRSSLQICAGIAAHVARYETCGTTRLCTKYTYLHVGSQLFPPALLSG